MFILENANGLLLKCLPENDADKIKHEFHEGECGGHLYWNPNAKKSLDLVTISPLSFKISIK